MDEKIDLPAAYLELLAKARGVVSPKKLREIACHARDAGTHVGRIAQVLEVKKIDVAGWWWKWKKAGRPRT